MSRKDTKVVHIGDRVIGGEIPSSSSPCATQKQKM